MILTGLPVIAITTDLCMRCLRNSVMVLPSPTLDVKPPMLTALSCPATRSPTPAIPTVPLWIPAHIVEIISRLRITQLA